MTWLQICGDDNYEPQNNSNTSKGCTHSTDIFLALVAANLAVELGVAEIGHAIAVLQGGG